MTEEQCLEGQRRRTREVALLLGTILDMEWIQMSMSHCLLMVTVNCESSNLNSYIIELKIIINLNTIPVAEAAAATAAMRGIQITARCEVEGAVEEQEGQVWEEEVVVVLTGVQCSIQGE